MSAAAKANGSGERLNRGRIGIGSRKKTPIDWTEVQRLYDTGVDQWAIVEKFGVSRATIRAAQQSGLLVLRTQPGKQAPEHNWLRCRFHSYRAAARRRNLSFEFSLDEFIEAVKRKCWYCGGGPVRVWRERPNASTIIFNGLDRADSALGYTTANVVTCCGRCNRAKNSLSSDDFLSLVKRITDRHFGNEHSSTQRIV